VHAKRFRQFGFAVVGGSEIRAFIESRRVHKPTATARATARADAIRECVNKIHGVARDYDGHLITSGMVAYLGKALESLLNEKGEKDG
jgi:hypothetical protein